MRWSTVLDSPQKVYNDVKITGGSQVHLGDINITNIYTNDTLAQKRLLGVTSPTRISPPRIEFATKASQKTIWLLLWWLVLNIDTLETSTYHGAETKVSFRIHVFDQWLAFWAFQFYRDQSLQLFRPEMRRLRPASHPFFKACEIGDVFEIKRLLTIGEASLHDVTEGNLDAMYFAITGRQRHSVQTLIDLKADVNQTFGIHSTSPLSWSLHHRASDIVELLVRNGADQQHISQYGCSPLFYLWPPTINYITSCIEMLKQLHDADTYTFDSQIRYLIDTNGWDVLNRMATSGQPEELDFVLKLGGIAHRLVGPLEWSAEFNAVYYNNLESLKRLRAYFNYSSINSCDKRGWTMLHIAVDEGHEDVIRYLVGEGASLWMRSIPVYSEEHVDPRFLGISVTPIDVARGHGEARMLMLDRIVRDVCDRTLKDLENSKQDA